MSMTLAERRQQLIGSFRKKEYRDAFVASRLATGIAFKLRATRERRTLTQARLAELSGSRQSVISRFENRNYGNYSINSLKKLCAALDVALIVDIVPFSEFIDRVLRLSPDDMAVPAFDDDHGLDQAAAAEVSGDIARSTTTATTETIGWDQPLLSPALAPTSNVTYMTDYRNAARNVPVTDSPTPERGSIWRTSTTGNPMSPRRSRA